MAEPPVKYGEDNNRLYRITRPVHPATRRANNKARLNAGEPIQLGRNQKCICGSGKRFKRCCRSKLQKAQQ